MAEPPRRRPPTQDVPIGSRTLPDNTLRNAKITPPHGQEVIKSVNIVDSADEPTRTMNSQEASAYKGARFLAPNDPMARTTITKGNKLPDGVDQLAADPPTGEIQKAKVWVATHKPPPDPDPRLILLREPDSQRAASFRVLRHRLEEHSDPRTIAVTSAEPKEGKTTCAANLAMALGECGRARVLLVEANLRSPSLAALFGFLPPECFAAQLTRHRERPLEPWSVVEVFSPSLHVAAVKPGPENENRPLLDGVAFGIAMDMLKRSGYDYVVIDTPPVLGSADVNLIEDYADGVLLTAWARQSSSRSLRRAVEQLAPAKILGITLLDV